jgi:hypothetical protein
MTWDSMAVAHEIGHNFSSPHSHCYNGIGGNSNPIDACRKGESGCYNGTSQSLPGPNSLTGAGHGTIMSYCHLLGGYSNIAMTFGSAPGFVDGILPAREASKMNSYVTSVASGNPSCMATTGPAVASISPATGPTTGAQPVTISGSGFVAGATVTIGGNAATAVAVLNSTTVTAVTPSHAAGTVSVIVTNPANGRAVLRAATSTAPRCPGPPTVTSTSPAGGPLAGGSLVTIKGTGFNSGATATFAGAGAVATTFVDSTTLRATTPANSAGIKSLTVTNPGGLSGVLANGFFYGNESGATSFYTVVPCRALDTRTTGGALAAYSIAHPDVTGKCGVPSGAKACRAQSHRGRRHGVGTIGIFPAMLFRWGPARSTTARA